MPLTKQLLPLAAALLVPGLANAAEVSSVEITGWKKTETSFGGFVSSESGNLIVFNTKAKLDAADTDYDSDNYLLDITTGAAQLLRPEPASESVVLEDGNSFIPRNFSADGNRLLLLGNSNQLSASAGSAAVVFDFTTREYLPASVDTHGDVPNYVGDTHLSANGRYVLFGVGTYLGGPEQDWEYTYYRRDLETETTIPVAPHINGGGILQRDGAVLAISPDGSKLLARAADGVFSASDTNGRSDYFLIDVESGVAKRLDVVMADGTEFTWLPMVTPSPDFDYLLITIPTIATSQIGNFFISEAHVVYNVETGETLGLSEFLGLTERHLTQFETHMVTGSYVSWGASARYVTVSRSIHLALPGDWRTDEVQFVFDRVTGQGWYAAIDEKDTDGILELHSRANGGVMYINEPEVGEDYVLKVTRPVPHDLELSASVTDGQLTLTLANAGDTDIQNIGVGFTFLPGAFSHLVFDEVFDVCSGLVNDTRERWDCRFGTLAAGEAEELTIAVNEDVEIEIEAVSMSDPDSNLTNNRKTVTVTKPAGDSGGGGGGGGGGGNDDGNSGGGGGGPFSPWLLLLALVGAVAGNRRIQSA